MNETNYSIDEVKLMAKVKRYKRRWKELRNYSEYLKCKLAKKALQVQELKAENAALHARIVELESERRWIPVSENPAVSGIYLVQNIYDDIYPVKFDAKTETWELQNYDTIIHWTNIPELPEVER